MLINLSGVQFILNADNFLLLKGLTFESMRKNERFMVDSPYEL